MSYDLKVDYGRLREMSKQLAGISGKLGEVDGDSDFTEDDFGNGVLLAAVRKFADGWRDGRKEIVEGVKAMSETLTGIADQYEDLDHGFEDDSGISNGNSGSGNSNGSGNGQGSGSTQPGTGPTGSGSTQPGSPPSGGAGAGPGAGTGPAPSPGAPPGDGSGPGLGIVPPIGVRPTDPVAPVRPGTPPIDPAVPPGPEQRNDRAVEQIDGRISDIDRELDWIERRLDQHGPDTEDLLQRREALLEERGFLTDLRDLLDPPADDTGDGRIPLGTALPIDVLPVDRRPVLLNPTDPVGDGRLVIGFGDPTTADNVVVRITHEPGNLGDAIASGSLGSDSARDLATQAPAGAGSTSVVSWQELAAGGSGGRSAGGAMSDLLRTTGSGAAVTLVADPSTLPMAREAIAAGAPVDYLVEIGDGPDRRVQVRNVRDAGGMVTGGDAPAAGGGTKEADDVLEKIVNWVRDTLGGER